MGSPGFLVAKRSKTQGSIPVVHAAQGRAPDFFCAPNSVGNGVGDRHLGDTVPASSSSAACGQRGLRPKNRRRTVSLAASQRQWTGWTGRAPLFEKCLMPDVAFEESGAPWAGIAARSAGKEAFRPTVTVCCGVCSCPWTKVVCMEHGNTCISEIMTVLRLYFFYSLRHVIISSF